VTARPAPGTLYAPVTAKETARGPEPGPEPGRDADAALVERARGGDDGAFVRLVDRHREAVWSFVRQRVRDRAAAEDIAQETFVTAYTRLATLNEPARFAGWLLGIARNLTMHVWRDAAHGATGGSLDEVEAARALAAGAGDDALAAVEERDLADVVARALGALEDPYRAVLTLRYRQDLSYAEIGSALGLAVGTVSSLIHRGLARLAPRLARLGRELAGE